MCSTECASSHSEVYAVECRILGRLEEERSDLANPRQCIIDDHWITFSKSSKTFPIHTICGISRNARSWKCSFLGCFQSRWRTVLEMVDYLFMTHLWRVLLANRQLQWLPNKDFIICWQQNIPLLFWHTLARDMFLISDWSPTGRTITTTTGSCGWTRPPSCTPRSGSSGAKFNEFKLP